MGPISLSQFLSLFKQWAELVNITRMIQFYKSHQSEEVRNLKQAQAQLFQ